MIQDLFPEDMKLGHETKEKIEKFLLTFILLC